MEQQSKISWVLTGINSKEADNKLEEQEIQEMLNNSFLEDSKFTLFLCGSLVEDKTGTLEEMEDGYVLIRYNMEEFQYGDYGIVSYHEKGSLLFMPFEMTDEQIEEVGQLGHINAKDLSGNTDNLQG